MIYTQQRCRCDYCSRDVKLSDGPELASPPMPSGWVNQQCDYVGNSVQCCADVACQRKLKRFLCENVSAEYWSEPA